MSNWFSTQDETSLVQCFYHEMEFIDVIESFIVPHLFENECKPIEKVSVKKQVHHHEILSFFQFC